MRSSYNPCDGTSVFRLLDGGPRDGPPNPPDARAVPAEPGQPSTPPDARQLPTRGPPGAAGTALVTPSTRGPPRRRRDVLVRIRGRVYSVSSQRRTAACAP